MSQPEVMYICAAILLGFIIFLGLVRYHERGEGAAFACGYHYAFNPKLTDDCANIRFKAVDEGRVSP